MRKGASRHPQYVERHMTRALLAVFAFILAGLASAQAPGVTSKSILVGQSAAFSGPAGQLGIQMNLGTKAYLDSVNAQGAVYARNIPLNTPNTKHQPTPSLETTKT